MQQHLRDIAPSKAKKKTYGNAYHGSKNNQKGGVDSPVGSVSTKKSSLRKRNPIMENM